MTNKQRNAAITAKIERYTQEHTATKDLASEAIQRATMTNKTEAMDADVATPAEIKNLLDALSPSTKLTATGSFNPQSKIVFNSGTRPTMTLHADGRITLSDDAQPTEAAAACIEAMSDMIQDIIKNAVSRQPTQSDALRTAREALKTTPLIGRTESVHDFIERQNAWLNGPYRAALQEQSK